MKKHPVDDLFKRKLSDLEKQPSSAAWSRIAATQKMGERKPAAWVWYAAASVTIVFIAGYLVWSGQNAKPYEQGKQYAAAAKTEKAAPDVRELSKASDPVITFNKDSEIAVVPKKVLKTGERKVVKAMPSVIDLEKQNVAERKEVERIETQQLAANDGLPSNVTGSVALPETEKTVTPQPLMAAKSEQEDNRTIVVTVNLPEQDENNKPKTSRFAKVFRQLKNVREGEPVDWGDVGFNPKAVVARVDDRLRDGEEKLTGKYRNFKERTKL